jgi:predicted small lipoprotein YifL
MERLIVIAGIALALAGCGLKGDLYLPPEPPPAAAPAEPAAPDGEAAAMAGDDGDARRQVPSAPDRSQAQ